MGRWENKAYANLESFKKGQEERLMAYGRGMEPEARVRRSSVPSGNVLLVICALVFAFLILKGISYYRDDGSLCGGWYGIKTWVYEKMTPENQERFYEMLVRRRCP